MLRIEMLAAGLLTAFACYVLWAYLRYGLRDRRLRRELPAKLVGSPLRCLLCGESLPQWPGAFERCPDEPRHSTWDFPGTPVGSFGLDCGRCERRVWFSAWLDGTVRTHFGWLWENTAQGGGPR